VAIEPTPNAWVRIEPPARAVVLGVDTDRAPTDTRGFRPSRRVAAPGAAYELQEHEVTWSEIEPWLAANPTAAQPTLPAWASDPLTRARLPATDITWTTAYAYCKSLGGSLPTEAQWEYAARGPMRRPNAWGAEKIDLALTHAFAGREGKPVPVMTSDQDRTPDGKLFDLIGNVQEWTVDLWREDKPGLDESWVEDGVQTFRALRGFPLGVPVRPRVQADGAAYRESLCGTGPCVTTTRDKLRFVGLRCARQVGDGEAEAHVWRTPAPAHAAVAPAPATLVLESPPPPSAVGSAGSAAAPAAPPPVADEEPPPPAPVAPVAPAAPAAPVVHNSLTPALIYRAVGAVRLAINHCGAGLEGAGTVRVGVTVAPSGSITSVEVRDTPDDWLGRCVATRIKDAVFPATEFGGTFSYPFAF
jgi:formylglycine-generating enzyme required for sulfatase activity